MRAVIMCKTAQLVGVGTPVVTEEKCGEAILEPTSEYPLGYGSATCMCDEVFDLYMRSVRRPLLPFLRNEKLVLKARSGNKIAMHVARLVK